MTRLNYLVIASATCLLAACGGDKTSQSADQAQAELATASDALPEVVDGLPSDGIEVMMNGAWRTDEAKGRDAFRNPGETLAFLGLRPDQTVVEIWPGGGWYTDIIAPYLATGGGTYIAAGFDTDGASDYVLKRDAAFREKYLGTERYGDVALVPFSKTTPSIAAEGSVDLILSFRNVHNWMSGGWEQKAFDDFAAALKPGGTLGIVEHRAKEDEPQDPAAKSGYVREDYVIALAEKAGLVLVETSELNANPLDTADHPFGVWTLPPRSATAPRGEAPATDFDAEKYLAIGESDRMTLKFKKPEA